MRRILAGTGKTLITLGVLILLFVAYQLWGTGIYTARAQNQLKHDFQAALHSSGGGGTPDFPVISTTTTPRPATTGPVAPATTTSTTEPPPDVPNGDAVAHLVIPKANVDAYVVEGVDEADLRKGPGHYPITPLPGQKGNAAIAGHRTTYGAPFGSLDDLENGDSIRVTTLQGTFEYTVYDKVVVSPNALEVLDADPTRPATLTLTSCHPKFSAAQRLVVKAALVLPPGAEPLPPTIVATGSGAKLAGEGLSGDTGSKTPTIALGILTLLIGLVWWLFFHRHPRWTTWIIGAIPFVIVLFFFYFYLERVLPANY